MEFNESSKNSISLFPCVPVRQWSGNAVAAYIASEFEDERVAADHAVEPRRQMEHGLRLGAARCGRRARLRRRIPLDGCGKSIAPSGHADDVARATRAVAKHLAQCGDVNAKRTVIAIAPGTLLDGDFDALEAMIQLNVVATSRLAVEAARAFLARGHGTIVNIASVLALTPEQVNGGYSGSKAFVLNLTQALQAEGGNGRARAGANE